MTEVIILCIVCTLLAGGAYYIQSLTLWAAITAWLFSLIIAYAGGTPAVIILGATFLFTLLSSKFKEKMKESLIGDVHLKRDKRDVFQIVANVGVGTFSLILFIIFKNDIFLVTYAAVMATSLADSVGSELGVLSKSKPFDICTFKTTQNGLSGAVTPLGIIASAIGAAIIGFLFHITTDYAINILLFITLAGFTGAIIDSILGSLIQVKYQCTKCNKLTEKKEHCKTPTIKYDGISWITNDVVNLLNNVFIFILCLVALFNVL